ncbi:MAG: DUF115 domain-containing protein [Proteobacteria bacterium]|uniref:DUF115 domain-containing protein n=1 Tax=Candidatus Avisuccinivibrio stercorigallinarum TaxID=2840704 RepID=A0A9D9DA00_9GAMM|nr:DUF115 domain-containing protein [Candidatus Avisuccinivibrio stercorigallinarum]
MAKPTAADLASLENLSRHFGKLTFEDLQNIKELSRLQAEMSDELIDRFARNIEAFEHFMPEIAAAFKNYRPNKTMEFFRTPEGAPNLIWVDSNTIFYNTMDPDALCKKQIEVLLDNQYFYQVNYGNEPDYFGQIHIRYMNDTINLLKNYKQKPDTPKLSGSVPCCIMFGVGLGYVLEHLYASIEVANLIIIEPDNDVFFASLHTFEWAPLIEFLKQNNYGLYLMLGEDKENLYSDLNNFYDRHGRFLAGFFWNFVHYRSEQINELTDLVLKEYSRTYAAMGFFDDHLFGISHGSHLLLNHARLGRDDVELPEQIRENVPVFVIGNGPSLSNDLDFIRKNQDKAVIIACGTAIETLYNAGIQADFYAATERIPTLRNTLRFLPDQHYLDDVVLFAGDVIHPSTVEMFKYCFIFSKPDEPFYWLMLQYDRKQARKWRPVFLMNPLVGNLGVSTALNLKFRHVYLFGLDNGTIVGHQNPHATSSGIYHSVWVKYNKICIDIIEKARALDPTIEEFPRMDDFGIDEFDDIADDDDEKAKDFERYIKATQEFVKRNCGKLEALRKAGHSEVPDWKPAPEINPYDIVKGNFGNDVRCHGLYKLARRYMEVICEYYKETSSVVNCSDGTALDFTTPQHSYELADKFDALPVVDKKELRTYLMDNMTFTIDITHEKLKELMNSENFGQIVDRMIKTLDKRPGTRLEFTQMLQSHAELIYNISANLNRYFGLLMDGSMNTFFITALRAMYLSADEEQGLKFANEIVDIYIKFLEDAKKLYAYLPDFCIGQHQHYTDFKVGYDHGDDKAPPMPKIAEVISEERLAAVVRKPFVKRYK